MISTDKQQRATKKYVKIAIFTLVYTIVAILFYSLLHGHHTGIYFPWVDGFVVLPLRHWAVFGVAIILTGGTLSLLYLKMDIVKSRYHSLLNRLLGKKVLDNPELNIYTRETCVYSVVKQDAPILVFIGIVFLMFVYSVRGVALVTHDDILSYMVIRFSEFESILRRIIPQVNVRGRYDFLRVPIVLIERAIYRDNNTLAYLAFFYTLRFLTISIFSYIVAKRTNRYIGYAMVLLFFAFAQVNFDHNLFVAYPFGFDTGILHFLAALEFFLLYYEKGKKRKHQILSVFFMLCSFFTYEAFVAYTAVFVLIAVIYNINTYDKKFAIRKFLHDVWIHITAALIYTAFWVIIMYTEFYNFGYAGTTIETANFSLRAVLATLHSLSTALFPMHDFFRFSHYEHFGFSGILDILNFSNISSFLMSGGIVGILIALCTSLATILIISKSKKLDTKFSMAILSISLVACFVFSIPLALSVQQQSWVLNYGFSGFVSSFHSYFWIICGLVVITNLLLHKIRLRRTFLVIVGILVFVVSLATNYSNSIMIEVFERNTIRRTMFDRMTSTDYFLSIEDGTVIYIEGFTGAHYQIDSLSHFVRLKNNQEITFTQDVAILEENRANYFMWYDHSNKIIKIGRSIDGFSGNEVFMLPSQDIAPASLNMHLDSDFSVVYVDCSSHGVFSGLVSFPFYIGVDGVVISADEMCMRTIRITQGSVLSNALSPFLVTGAGELFNTSNRFHNILGAGWNGLEYWGIWNVGHTADLNFSILADDIKEYEKLELTFGLRAFPSPTYLSVYINGSFAAEYVLSGGGGHLITLPITCDILTETSVNEEIYIISIRFEIANPISPAALGISRDHRELGIGLESFRVSAR